MIDDELVNSTSLSRAEVSLGGGLLHLQAMQLIISPSNAIKNKNSSNKFVHSSSLRRIAAAALR